MYNVCIVIFLRHCPPPHNPERVSECEREKDRERETEEKS